MVWEFLITGQNWQVSGYICPDWDFSCCSCQTIGSCKHFWQCFFKILHCADVILQFCETCSYRTSFLSFFSAPNSWGLGWRMHWNSPGLGFGIPRDVGAVLQAEKCSAPLIFESCFASWWQIQAIIGKGAATKSPQYVAGLMGLRCPALSGSRLAQGGHVHVPAWVRHPGLSLLDLGSCSPLGTWVSQLEKINRVCIFSSSLLQVRERGGGSSVLPVPTWRLVWLKQRRGWHPASQISFVFLPSN